MKDVLKIMFRAVVLIAALGISTRFARAQEADIWMGDGASLNFNPDDQQNCVNGPERPRMTRHL